METRLGLAIGAGVLLSSLVFAEGWMFRAGALYRDGMKMELSGSTYAGDQAANYMPGANGRSADRWTLGPRPSDSDLPPPEDDISQYQDRTFDDGFVFSSPPTEFTGQTWYWGYDSASQYDAQSQTLTYTRQTTLMGSGAYTDHKDWTETRSSSQVLENDSLSDAQTFSGSGFFVEGSRAWYLRNRVLLEWTLGLSYWQGSETLEDSTYHATITETTYAHRQSFRYTCDTSRDFTETYTYYDGNNVVGSVPAPYEGTYEGPGPLLSDERPSDRDVSASGLTMENTQLQSQTTTRSLAGQRSWSLDNHVAVDADVHNTALNVGARAGLTWGKGFYVYLQPGVSLNYLMVDLKRSEVLYSTPQGGTAEAVASWSDSASDEAWIIGVGGAVGVQVPLLQTWFVSVSLSHEWMLDQPEFTVGPSRVKVDLSGTQAGASVGMRF